MAAGRDGSQDHAILCPERTALGLLSKIFCLEKMLDCLRASHNLPFEFRSRGNFSLSLFGTFAKLQFELPSGGRIPLSCSMTSAKLRRSHFQEEKKGFFTEGVFPI
jgi:hypothetical protein